jgi:ribosomal protein S6--L-glutamate ligase
MASGSKKISLGKRLRSSHLFRCVGTLPNWQDYPDSVREEIRCADKIYYPSAVYEDLFRSLGKNVFPSNFHQLMGNKIAQTALFQLLGISHPRTRVYYGKNRLERILRDFAFPFVLKTPVGSSKGSGVWLAKSESDLHDYLESHQPAYVQQYLSIDRDLRVVLIAGHIVHAYWRIQKPGDFRNNVAQGARICYQNIPPHVLEFAADVAQLCHFGEVGLDVCICDGTCYVIEANMVYGLEGFRRSGRDIYSILAGLGENKLL